MPWRPARRFILLSGVLSALAAAEPNNTDCRSGFRSLSAEFPEVGLRNVQVTGKPKLVRNVPSQVIQRIDHPTLGHLRDLGLFRSETRLVDLQGQTWIFRRMNADGSVVLHHEGLNREFCFPIRPLELDVYESQLVVTDPRDPGRKLVVSVKWEANGEPGTAELEQARSLLALLPFTNLDAVHAVWIHEETNSWDPYWTSSRPIRSSAGAAGREWASNTIHVFPPWPSNQLTRDAVARHEFGHVVAIKRFGGFTPPQQWADAMVKDGRSPSRYAETHISEDFAESVRIYLEVDGGTDSPALREKYAARFAILDDVFSADPMARREGRDRLLQRTSHIAAVGILALAGGFAVYVYVNETDKDEQRAKRGRSKPAVKTPAKVPAAAS